MAYKNAKVVNSDLLFGAGVDALALYVFPQVQGRRWVLGLLAGADESTGDDSIRLDALELHAFPEVHAVGGLWPFPRALMKAPVMTVSGLMP